MGKKSEQVVPKRRNVNVQQIYEKLFNTINCQGNVNENQPVALSHLILNDCYPKYSMDNMHWQGCGEKVTLNTL